MSAVKMIAVYNTLFYVFLIIAVLGLVLAVFFFFYFDIPTIRSLMTGKAKKETIRRMEEKNAKTGNMRFTYPDHTGDISYHNHTGRIGNSGRLGRSEKRGFTSRIGRTGNRGNDQAALKQVAVTVQNELETSALQNGELETAALNNTASRMQMNHKNEFRQMSELKSVNMNHSFTVTQSVMLIHTDEII